ncbi:alkaline phosphatase family protein [Anabaena lutea]|uniref:Alkaline phosphatase family protein n=1 Tax=Anabaena lutea FACHB-196 TaxID=2692881 RepID=A0ABR8FB13_9NOST|nr:alkaline phosphatase family protein [Anabaena lutea]MBD2567395.1 alkaline phosphatase family protein [Anabaena lutea FACHB-196]
MKNPVIAIGMDAGDPVLIDKWISQGHLKNISKLRQQGAYGLIKNTAKYCGNPTEYIVTEGLWAQFSTGCGADKTGYWDIVKYKPENYEIDCDLFLSGYDYKEYPPFYALGDNYKVAVFDLPVSRISEQVNGFQMLGWGGHFPYATSGSNPPELFPEIIRQYGENPILFNDTGVWWDLDYVKWLQPALKESISKRTAISCDLLQREPWDLYLTIFGEPHTAGHDIYNYSQSDHPLYPYLSKNGTVPDPLLETYQNIDAGIGKILAEAPENAYILCFSLHGMGTNYSDIPSAAFLPEILYRFNFPGKTAIGSGNLQVSPPPITTNPIRNSWPGEVWIKNYEPNPIKRLLKPLTPSKFLHSDQNGLASPYRLMEESVPFGWMPARWYQPLWSQMRAFALPSFAHGHIRINLQGREGNGIVSPSEYEALCDELTQVLYRLKDGRTGEPLVKQVVRTRKSATENNPKLPDSDLLVLWHERMTDVVDSPDVGRIGPLTYFRAGSHWNRGFLMAKGPGITPGSNLPDGESVDLAPTILELMGAPIPDYFDGKSLLKNTPVNN